MSQYRRAFVPGGTFFLTLVTYERKPLFAEDTNVARLRDALRIVKQEWPFSIEAAVILPDHLHMLWVLPSGDADFSRRAGRCKALFTKSLGELDYSAEPSRYKHRERNIWQRRFWEHTIRDPADFERHVNYIHYNPVEHGLVACPHAWPHSSFMRWVEREVYCANWCCTCEGRKTEPPDWGIIENDFGE